jgi:hypothetical protein
MSRYDYLYIDKCHFKNLSEQELNDIDSLEFQTKDLDREYLEYSVGVDGLLVYMDYHYELVESEIGMFSMQLRRMNDGIVKSNHTGIVMFYGKPYEHIYNFQAKFTKGKLIYIRLLSIE